MVVNHLMFADDICVFSRSISGLQCHLNICGDCASEHEITFDCTKTFGVLFCPKKYKQPAPSNVFLNGVRVQFFDQVKYLGVWINASDVVDNVTSETDTETWLKLRDRDRDFAIKAETET